MTTTMYRARDPQPELIAWVTDHGHDPAELHTILIEENDGTIVAHRFLRNSAGEKYVDPENPDQVATEQVRITPTRPLPTKGLEVIA